MVHSITVNWLSKFQFVQNHYILVTALILASPVLMLIAYQIYYAFTLQFNGTYAKAAKLPTIPYKNWLVGNFGSKGKGEQVEFDPGQLHIYLHGISQHIIGEGKTYKLRLFNQVLYVLVDANDCNAVLNSRHTDFTKAHIYQKMIGFIMPKAMLITDGDEWQKQRKLLNPAFHYKPVNNTHPIIWEETQILLDTVSKAAKSGKTVDISLQFEGLTLDVLGKTGFDFDFDAQRNPQYREVMRNMLMEAQARGYRPLPFMSPMKQIAALLGFVKINTVIRGVFKRKVASGIKAKENDLLAIMMKAQSDGQHDWVTWRQIRDQMILFLFAGSDTTSSLMSSAVYLLATNPRVQKKLQAELDKVIEPGVEPEADLVLSKIPYLRAVINETLRIRPSVSTVGRRALIHTTLPSGAEVTPDTNLMVPIYAIHHNKHYWGDDAEEFRPERWLSEDESEVTNTPHKDKDIPLTSVFIPFVSGARNCIGQTLARLEAHLVIAALCRQYTFTYPDGDKKPAFVRAITMNYVEGLHVHAEKRSK